jgi:hypothetical protein
MYAVSLQQELEKEFNVASYGIKSLLRVKLKSTFLNSPKEDRSMNKKEYCII